MKCPRCSLFDIPEGAPGCAVCGYQLPGAEAKQAPPAVLTELDARRELTREFRIEALLQPGDQGSTIVYLAYDPRQDRQVEVKVAPRQPLRDAGAEDRFRRAAEAAAALDHPHILPIYRCGATANFLWFSTKPFQGRSVAGLVRTNGPMAPAHVSEALRRELSSRPTERFPTVLDFVGAVGGTSPGAGQRAALFSLNPRRGPGSPIVIMDDEPEPRRVGRRLAAAAGIVLALGAGGVWLSLSTLPAAPPLQRRLGVGRPPATTAVPIPPTSGPPSTAPPDSAPRDSQPASVTPSLPAPRALPPATKRVTAPRVTRTAPQPPAVN